MDSSPAAHTTENDFNQLSVAEKIVQLQDAWDRIAENPESVEVTPAQKEVLDLRLEDLERHPNDGTTWEEIKSGLQGR